MKPNEYSPRAVLTVTGSVVLGILAGGAGLILRRFLPAFDAAPLHYILMAALVILCLVNRIGAHSFVRSHFARTSEERAAMMEAHRAACDADPEAVLRELGNIAVLPVTQLVLYYLLLLAMLVTGAMAWKITALLPFILLILSVIPYAALMPPPLQKNELVPKGALPHLHALAERAAHTAGVRGTIRLQLVSEASCEVSRFGGTYVLFLGTRALATMTEEELYADLVRRLAFEPTRREDRLIRRHYHLASLGSAKPRPVTFVFDLFFSLADAYMEWYSPLYNTAVSRRNARRATKRLAEEGLSRAYLNARAKVLMWEDFDHEWFDHIREPFFAPEMPLDNPERMVALSYRRAMSLRLTAWSELLPGRLPPANYLGMSYADERRLMGAENLPVMDRLVFPEPQSDYGRDVEAALDSLTRIIPAETYAAARREHYLEPLATVTEWEASDKNRPTSELSPVLNAYHALARFEEVEALCDRIIETEPSYFAQAHAIYFKGMCRLRVYDTDGIDYIYRAMDLNKNYMQEGLEAVDAYCRLCGLSDELETCRRRAETLMSAHAANHEGASSLGASDRLVKETELDGELSAILDYMVRVGEGSIERIYLVRKVIAEDFFTSAFVLYFTPGTDREVIDRAYEAIFHYLDGYPTDWQFSLFLYNRETEAAVKRVPDALVWEKKDE